MGDSAHQDDDGRRKFYPIIQPQYSTAHNSGRADGGKKTIISLVDTDVKQTLSCVYNDTVQLYRAHIFPIGAPLGAYIDIRALNEDNSVKEYLARGLLLYGDNALIVESQRLIRITALEKLRITVYNSDGSGVEDGATAFRVLINFTMFR